MMRLVGRSLVMLALIVAGSSILHAHMKLVKTDPGGGSTVTAKPSQVRLVFTQMPSLPVSKLTLQGPSGEVKLGTLQANDDKSLAAPVIGEMADGAYTLRWQTAGDDGHVQKGEVAFSLRMTK